MSDRWPRGMPEPDAAAYVGLSVSSIRAARGRRDFPEPAQLTPGRIVYLREDLDAFLDRKAGRTAISYGEKAWMEA